MKENRRSQAQPYLPSGDCRASGKAGSFDERLPYCTAGRAKPDLDSFKKQRPYYVSHLSLELKDTKATDSHMQT